MHVWLRAEIKNNEQRTALTPQTCKALKQAGIRVTVEKSSKSIFNIDDYTVECVDAVVESGSWQTQAPKDALIVGLKELPENDTSALEHTHIFFAHCYKQQSGWMDILDRFKQGGGCILDLEFLTDTNGRRVAAFGYHAGFAGAAMGLDVWCHQQVTSPNSRIKYPGMSPFDNQTLLIDEIKSRLEAAKLRAGRLPRVMVMGALGRCGTGATDFVRMAGISDANIVKWDMAETAKGGPFPEILDVDVFVNCIYLSKPIPPFVDMALINKTGSARKLSVVVDVSCDTTNPHNPIPIYSICTTFDKPTVAVEVPENTLPLDVVSIDHLPTLLPREASEAFDKDLLPSLLQLPDRKTARVWMDAEALFHKKVVEMDAINN